jgi:D-alanyl-D-alanine carboxypeptidase (penicillin-binding protein 5/6)
MASVAKVVTALVVLDFKPIVAGETGPIVDLTAADFQSYLDYDQIGARSVAVFADEQWTELELLQALLLGSSNNHADTVARWAFGSVDAYVEAANTWLVENGLTGSAVVDATGLHDASAGTATDLARLAVLAATDPIVSAILASPASALANRRGVENTTSYLPEEGITGISRSYTDAAGVCFLFTATVSDGASSFTFSGAFIGEPTYDDLSADVTALMASARAGIGPLPVLAAGDTYATFESAWGDEAAAVVGVSRTRYAWQATTPEAATVTLKDFATSRTGANVGQVRLTVAGEELSAALKLDQPINDPGTGWRLLHPVVMITALLDSRG